MNDESAARDLARLQREARVREADRKVVIRGIMSVRAGREWMLSILTEWCNVFSTPWAAERCATDFNCGQQNIGLRLTASVIEAAPDDYLLMLKEQADERHKPSQRPDDGDGNEDGLPGGIDDPIGG